MIYRLHNNNHSRGIGNWRRYWYLDLFLIKKKTVKYQQNQITASWKTDIMFTVKNNILANSNCEVIFLTPTEEGKKHDKKIADESEYRLPEGSKLLQDTGFQGFFVSNVEILQPAKKPRGKELTQEQKGRNRNISKIRIRIEHIVSGIKRYRIVKDKCRNWIRGFTDQVMEIACGLHNLRLRFRPWQEVKLQKI
ncbi:MAG: transposase family protein [Candidatus Electrothrix gigas]